VKLAGTVETEAVVKSMERKDLNYEGVCGVIEAFDEIHNPYGGGWKKRRIMGVGGLPMAGRKKSPLLARSIFIREKNDHPGLGQEAAEK